MIEQFHQENSNVKWNPVFWGGEGKGKSSAIQWFVIFTAKSFRSSIKGLLLAGVFGNSLEHMKLSPHYKHNWPWCPPAMMQRSYTHQIKVWARHKIWKSLRQSVYFDARGYKMLWTRCCAILAPISASSWRLSEPSRCGAGVSPKLCILARLVYITINHWIHSRSLTP